MYSNILYDEKTNNIYIQVYKLGKGAFSEVWFCIEFTDFFYNLKNKKVIINYKALKIHKNDSYEQGILETKIDKLLTFNNQKSSLINYPLSYFEIDDHVIVVYDVAVGSLYDVLKSNNKKLNIKFIEDIVQQMIDSIQFVHDCGYIHTDIKPENFLLIGINKLQEQIINYTINYNFYEKFKLLNINKMNYLDKIKEVILCYLLTLCQTFNIDNKLLNKNSSSNNSFSSNIKSIKSDESLVSNELTESNNSIENSENSSDINTNNTFNSSNQSYSSDSYDSIVNEYDHVYDSFHIKKILMNIVDDGIKIEDDDDKNNNIIYNYSELPIIKLTDFGLIEKINSNSRTINTRYYRSPEVILGLPYNEKTDIWSLGCSLYELVTGDILIDIDKDKNIERFDKDLINIKIIAEKLGKNSYKNIINLINSSNRKDYFLNNDNTLRFYKKYNFNAWSDNLLFQSIHYKNILNIIKNMLIIDANDRIL